MTADQVSVYEVADAMASRPLCVCCRRALWWQEQRDGRVACVRCEQDVTHWLREIADRWEQLPSVRMKPASGAGGGERCGGGYGPGGSAAPGNLEALSLLAGDVARRLQVHEDTWRRQLGWPLATWRGNTDQTLAAILTFLGNNLHWACHSAGADVDDLHHDARRLAAEMRATVTGERTSRTPIGHPCPQPALGYDADDPGAPACGGELRMDPRTITIRCATCRTAVARHHWLELGITLGTITLDQETAA